MLRLSHSVVWVSRSKIKRTQSPSIHGFTAPQPQRGMRCGEVNYATLCYVSSTTKHEYVCVVCSLLEVDFGTQNTMLNLFSVWVAVGDRLRASLAGLTETILFYAYKLFFFCLLKV